MKKSAKNRIVIWSIVSVLLIGLLIAGIFCMSTFPMFKMFSINTSDILPDLKDYKTASSEVEFTPTDVKNISINWVSGSVSIEHGTSDKIEISESSSSTISEDKAMQYKLNSDGTLSIVSCKSSNIFNFWSTDLSKALVIKVPQNKSFNRFDISTTSANVNITSMNVEDSDIETTSGEITLTDITGKNAEVNSTSGKTNIDGNINNEISIDTVSGDINVDSDCRNLDTESISATITATLGNNINKADANTVSGNISISLPESISGFKADYNSVSGNFSSDFEGNTSDNNFTYKNDNVELNFDTVSGDMRVKKIK